MEGKGSRGRSSLVVLLFLALVVLAAGAAQRPPATKKKGRYMLVEVQAGAEKPRMAMREDGSYLAGFAKGRQQWFATPGTETLLQSGYYVGGTGNSRRRSSRDNAVGKGLGTLLAIAMVVNNNRSTP
ncbi:hypothetical protein BS78_K223800 [Paspalum vaginatum]|uniref:rRNA N-glycosylase n=1 Tax=Paspalum vaginatum TaxID=158149 RepID=A0A9W7XBS1_9POAL|nr:hypothetical protein BS78_K223800 [Paspalum vaginatum]